MCQVCKGGNVGDGRRVARAMSPTLSSDEEDDEQHRAPAVANRLKTRRTLNAEAIVKNTRGAHSHTTPRSIGRL